MEGTFMSITNKDIYDKLEEMIKRNYEEHTMIQLHQIDTNGKVKLNRWISSTAIALCFVLIGIIINIA